MDLITHKTTYKNTAYIDNKFVLNYNTSVYSHRFSCRKIKCIHA
jgi:hypothetical protein